MDKLNNFKLYLLQKGMAQATVTKNVSCMKSLLASLPDVKKPTLDRYFLTRLEAGKSKAYLNIVIGTLHHWGEYTNDGSFKGFKYFKLGETHKAIMSDKEIEEFINLPYIPTPAVNKENYENWTLFFKVLAYSGMRPSEVANLTIESIDFGSNLYILDKTKTTPRSVPIAPSVLGDLTAHVRKLNNDLIFTRKGRPFNKAMWKHYFDARLKRLGIKRKNLTCYSLRHSFITRWAGENINLFKIKRIVGHKNIKTTENYVHLVTKDLIAEMKNDPLARTSLPFYDRLKMFREGVLKLLEDLALTSEEETKMLDAVL